MNAVLKELQRIPGVGKSIAADLYDLGIRSIRELQDEDPEQLYLKLCTRQGMRVDRCVLYVFRCAVYYASNKEHDRELLKWWNWKDKKTVGAKERLELGPDLSTAHHYHHIRSFSGKPRSKTSF
jgi:nucleotidyltransferase/DNA polymerase involved in DNA repair